VQFLAATRFGVQTNFHFQSITNPNKFDRSLKFAMLLGEPADPAGSIVWFAS
jgi:hypothetical protein